VIVIVWITRTAKVKTGVKINVTIIEDEKAYTAMYFNSPKAQTKEAEGDDSRDSTLYAENKTL